MVDEGKTGMLHFIYNSNIVCVLVSHDIDHGEFVMQVPYYPPIETLDDYRNDQSRCLKIIENACFPPGSAGCKVQIMGVNSWRMEAVVASKYASNDGDYSRVVLAGDSAHAFPPSGGFGLNTGIGDVFSLAHKISSSIDQKGLPSIVAQTYSDERKLIGTLTTDLSMVNYDKSLMIAKKLNLDAGHAKMFANLVNAVTPNQFQKGLLSMGMGFGLTLL